MVSRDLPDNKDSEVNLEQLVKEEKQEQLEIQVNRVALVSRDQLVNRVKEEDQDQVASLVKLV